MPEAQPGQEQRMVTDAMIRAGRNYLLGFGIDDMDNDEVEGIYAAMHAARPTADLGEDGELVAKLRDDRRRTPFEPWARKTMAEAADRLILYREALERIAEWPLPLPRSVDDAVNQRESVRDIARAVLSRSGG